MSTVPPGQQCRADGCTSRRVRHGAGRCEAHFRTLCDYIASNPTDREAPAVRRALAARKRTASGKGSPPPEGSRAVEADSGGFDLAGALSRAESAADVLAALAADVDPNATAPTPETLAAWTPLCPDAVMADVLTAVDAEPLEATGAVLRDARIPGTARALFLRILAAFPSMNPNSLTARWLARPLATRGPHPLAGIVRAWIERPPSADAETRPDPLLPVAAVIREVAEREAGQLAFGGVLDPGRDVSAQLPLLPAPDGPRVPLLELADVRGGPVMARGRGAPLDLRLFVGACLWTPHHARSARVRLAVTVRELRDWLWPRGWERRRDLPKLREALWRARDFTIPDGRGLWLPFALRRDPGPDARLDDVAVIDVELPPGAGDGPVIDRWALALLGVESAPRFRAYIAAHSVAWRPGVTRVPHPASPGYRLWSGDPDKYPTLTAADRDRLAFGDVARARKEGRTKADGHWEDLPGVEIIGRMVDGPDGRRGWRIVPDAAAAAIRKRRDG